MDSVNPKEQTESNSGDNQTITYEYKEIGDSSDSEHAKAPKKAQSFEVDFNNGATKSKKKSNLQDAFKKYKKKKQVSTFYNSIVKRSFYVCKTQDSHVTKTDISLLIYLVKIICNIINLI